jgi:hypothetical protein
MPAHLSLHLLALFSAAFSHSNGTCPDRADLAEHMWEGDHIRCRLCVHVVAVGADVYSSLYLGLRAGKGGHKIVLTEFFFRIRIYNAQHVFPSEATRRNTLLYSSKKR